MKNILIVSCVFPPEPVVSASLSLDLAEELSNKYKVTVISPKPTRPMGYEFGENLNEKYLFKHILLKSFTYPKSSFIGRFRESYSFGEACKDYIKKNSQEIDVIYMNTWPIFSQLLTVRVAKGHNIPTIVHIQDIYPEAFVSKLPSCITSIAFYLFFPIEWYIVKYSTKLITISNGMKNLLLNTRKVSKSKIEVVYNWQDELKFSIESRENKYISKTSQRHFMFLGSLGRFANIDNLIRTFANLNKDFYKLTIAGEGSEKSKLEKLATELNATNVVFIKAPANDVGRIQALSDILILSLKKGAAGLALPSKLPAYMFSAKPIIASVDYDSDTAEAIRNANCGWVVEPENISALKDIMQKALNMSNEELGNIGLKGREYALKHFSKKNNLPKLVQIIEALIDR